MASSDRILIQIDAREDATSIKDRLSFHRGTRILLVWPEEGTALGRKLDLVLIQREAMRRQIRLAIVTHDDEVIKNARDLNISTFETIGASERGRWKRGRAKVFTTRYQRPKDNPDPDDLKDVASRIYVNPRSISRVQLWAVRVGVLLIMLFAIGGVTYFVVPTATVTLALAEDTISVTVNVTISTDPSLTAVDVGNAIIPSQVVRVQATQSFSVETTGTVQTGNVRASGAVVFINTTDESLEIPLGTQVQTTDGRQITFVTTAAATLPAGDGQEASVPIEAVANVVGASGNVAENQINAVIGPLADRVIVRNRTPTSGGQAQTARVVTEDDHERLERSLRQLLQQTAFEQMPNAPNITPRSSVILETLTIEEIRDDAIVFSAEPGDRVDTVSLRMEAIVSARAFNTQFAEQVVYAQLAREVPRGREIQLDTVQYERGPVTVQGDNITFTMTGISVVAGQVDESMLRGQLSGKSVDEALAYIIDRVDIAPGTLPEIIVSPGWLRQMPAWSRRIEINQTAPELLNAPTPTTPVDMAPDGQIDPPGAETTPEGGDIGP